MNHESGTDMGPLKHGQTVAIIGGGPGGAACAIALKNLAAEGELSAVFSDGSFETWENS